MKLKTFILISAVSLGAFIGANKISWSLPQRMDGEAALGKKVWQKYNCVSCHTLFGNGGYVGEDLTHITKQKDPAELMEFFRNPPILPPNRKKKHPGLTDEESQNLIQYFEYLSHIPTLGWPPEPKPREGGEGL